MNRKMVKCLSWFIFLSGLGNFIYILSQGTGSDMNEHTLKLMLSYDKDRISKYVCEFVPEPFLLERLTFESDVFMQPSEFYYLVDLPEGTEVNSSDLERVLSYLAKKDKFEEIELRLTSGDQGKKLHVQLTGKWTFHKLKMTGILVGKENYNQFYMIESGDVFDEQRHSDSVSKIIESFRNEGYFNAQVEDTLSYDKQTKAVTATLHLSRGERFTINSVKVVVHDSSAMKEDEKDFIKMKLDKKLSQNLVHRTYSRELLNQEISTIQQYLVRHGYVHLNISMTEKIMRPDEHVDLTFTVSLHTKRKFVFFGNQFFSGKKLLETIMVFERSVWLLPMSILADEIIKTYHAHGFWDVSVDTREENERSFFVIKEGARAIVDKVIVDGVEGTHVQTLIKRWFRPLVRAGYFDEELLKSGIAKLTAFYIAEGFWDAKVVQKRFEPVENKKDHYVMYITLDQGRRRYLSDITIPQFPSLLSKGPFKKFERMRKKQKVPFDMSLLHAQKRWLNHYCKLSDLADSTISYELKNDDNDISVIWDVKPAHEGITFGKTVILGSSSYPFDNVVRELQYDQGQPWDRKKLNQTISRLKDLEIFETIHAYPSERDMQQPDQQPVVIKLQKDDPYEVRLRAGLGLEQFSKPITLAGITYKFGGTFIIKNPFDCGDIFCLNGDISRSMRSIDAQYRRPWLFNMPIRTVIKGYSTKYQQPGFFYYRKGFYEVSQNGALICFARPYKWIDANINCGIEWMDLSVQDDFKLVADCVASAIDFNPRLLHKYVPYVFFTPTIMIDNLDNKLNPIRGTLTVLTCKGMLPLSSPARDSAFFKILAEQSVFIPCMSFVLALRLRLGHVFYQQFNNINPMERFYLGGANSLRSYDTDGAPPLGSFCDTKGVRRWAPMGGKTMMNANAEVRFPIWGDVGGVVFQDFGILSSAGLRGVGKKGLLAGTGFGIRYNTPIGPLRFDIGWKWSTCDPFDRSYSWFLTFGNAF